MQDDGDLDEPPPTESEDDFSSGGDEETEDEFEDAGRSKAAAKRAPRKPAKRPTLQGTPPPTATRSEQPACLVGDLASPLPYVQWQTAAVPQRQGLESIDMCWGGAEDDDDSVDVVPSTPARGQRASAEAAPTPTTDSPAPAPASKVRVKLKRPSGAGGKKKAAVAAPARPRPMKRTRALSESTESEEEPGDELSTESDADQPVRAPQAPVEQRFSPSRPCKTWAACLFADRCGRIAAGDRCKCRGETRSFRHPSRSGPC